MHSAGAGRRLPAGGTVAGDRSARDGEVDTAAGTQATPAHARRTPDESTAALASNVLATSPLDDGRDLPSLGEGEILAGRFEIIRFIAQGGMGAVYEANDA